jgi:hypothetical protein
MCKVTIFSFSNLGGCSIVKHRRVMPLLDVTRKPFQPARRVIVVARMFVVLEERIESNSCGVDVV